MRAVNLLPRDHAKGARKRPAAVVQLAIVAPFVVVALLAAGYLLSSSAVNNKKGTLRALQTELDALPAPPPESQAEPELAAQHSLRIAALASALQTRVAWDRILRQISSVLPEDVWLTTLSADGSAVATPPPPPPTTTDTTSTDTSTETTTTTPVPAPATPTTVPLTINGFTYSQEGVARLLSRLAVIPELQDVKLIESTQSEIARRPVFSFSIQAGVRRQGT
jgi:Tfp pilus assembly protein PilN